MYPDGLDVNDVAWCVERTHVRRRRLCRCGRRWRGVDHTRRVRIERAPATARRLRAIACVGSTTIRRRRTATTARHRQVRPPASARGAGDQEAIAYLQKIAPKTRLEIAPLSKHPPISAQFQGLSYALFSVDSLLHTTIFCPGNTHSLGCC